MKLIVFDLDKTLAKLGEGIIDRDVQLLKQLEDSGATIAICSGKPAYYLCGFMRQVGLKYPVLVGENGAVIQFGVDLPPKKYYKTIYDKRAGQTIFRMKLAIDRRFPDMWYQPNEVALTPFPKTDEEFDWIQKYIDDNELEDVDVYRHCDSFDIVPKGLNKKTGMEYLGNLLGITLEETIAVGDGVNDYPMFEYAGISIGICVKDKDKVDYDFETITEVLEFLLRKV